MFKLSATPALSAGQYQSSGISITLMPDTPRLSLAPLTGELDQVNRVLLQSGVVLPAPTEAVLEPCVVLPLGQGQWLLQGAYPALDALTQIAALTDQSDAWCAFELEGVNLGCVLERLVATAPASYAYGKAARTQIEHIGCWVIGTGQDRVQILGPRSSAQSLFTALKHAADAVLALVQDTEVR